MSDIYEAWRTSLFRTYKTSPNILKEIQIFAAEFQKTEDVLAALWNQTDLDNIGGIHLDFIGGLIGVPRPPAQREETDLLWMCALDEMDLDPDESMGLTDSDGETGGYMTGFDGCELPGVAAGDDEYRTLIRIKADTFRKKATHEVLYMYLLQFGYRMQIEEDVCVVTLTPESFNEINYWVRDYIISKGFRPAGIRIQFAEQEVSE